jgi:hypothetical protein
LAIPVLFIQLSGCVGQDRNIDRDTWYAYKQGDTLIYKNTITRDTFLVEKIIDRWIDVDSNEIELLEVYLPELNKACEPYCEGMNISSTHKSFSIVIHPATAVSKPGIYNIIVY